MPYAPVMEKTPEIVRVAIERRDALELAARIDAIYAEGREREALEAILRAARNARRSGRRARRTPQASVEATLDLVEALARGGLGLEP